MAETDEQLEAFKAHNEVLEETLKQHVSLFSQLAQMMIDALGEDFVKSLIEGDNQE